MSDNPNVPETFTPDISTSDEKKNPIDNRPKEEFAFSEVNDAYKKSMDNNVPYESYPRATEAAIKSADHQAYMSGATQAMQRMAAEDFEESLAQDQTPVTIEKLQKLLGSDPLSQNNNSPRYGAENISTFATETEKRAKALRTMYSNCLFEPDQNKVDSMLEMALQNNSIKLTELSTFAQLREKMLKAEGKDRLEGEFLTKADNNSRKAFLGMQVAKNALSVEEAQEIAKKYNLPIE